MLPGPSLTDWVCTTVAGILNPETDVDVVPADSPSTMEPNGAWISPFCTMVAADTTTPPSADSGAAMVRPPPVG